MEPSSLFHSESDGWEYYVMLLVCLTQTVNMVEVFLRVEGRFVAFLSIPLNEIQPLCIHPLKWLRFVAFAICGARGHLFPSTAVGTRPVDYETSVPVETCYYVPEGESHVSSWP